MANYSEVLKLAQQIAEAWTDNWEEDAATASHLRYNTLSDVSADVANSSLAAGFQQVIGENTWGDVAGFLIDDDAIGILSAGEDLRFIVMTTRESPELRQMLRK